MKFPVVQIAGKQYCTIPTSCTTLTTWLLTFADWITENNPLSEIYTTQFECCKTVHSPLFFREIVQNERLQNGRR